MTIALFPGTGSIEHADFNDGLAHTIILVEAANIKVYWAEPGDLDISAMSLKINDPKRPGLSACDKNGPAVSFGDGRVKRMNNALLPKMLKALFTINGGEKINPDDLE